MAWMLRCTVYPVPGFLKCFLPAKIYVGKSLWIAVEQWKPTALDLNHYFVTFLKGVVYIGEHKFHPGHL
jgi:hypothetical protein